MKKVRLLFPLFLGVLFPLLFHKQQAGINVLIFNLLIISFLIWNKRLNIINSINLLLAIGTFLSALMVVIHGSHTALTVNIISLIMVAGLTASPKLHILSNSLLSFLAGSFTSPIEYLKELASVTNTNRKVAKTIRILAFLVVPIITLILFISIYSASSLYYQHLTGNVLTVINDIFKKLTENISPAVFWLAVTGLIVGIVLAFSKIQTGFDLPYERGEINMIRERRYYKGSPAGLHFELRTAVFTFILLNIALAVMNILDLWHVWINFKWDGGYLKQFVHEGTWLLILSIVISVALVLWYFRGNLNFYSKNKLLVYLSRIWLWQNIFLALSVAVRNYWYLSYFNLAYKRIWVYAFLILVIYGLFTVLVKVNKRRTIRYLLIKNSITAYIVFAVLSFVNWDNVIARFNINRAEVAFFHTNFMDDLDSSTLPILIMDKQQIVRIKEAQSNIFSYHANYESLEQYNRNLINRKNDFLLGFPELHWLSWTYSDYKTFRELKSAE